MDKGKREGKHRLLGKTKEELEAGMTQAGRQRTAVETGQAGGRKRGDWLEGGMDPRSHYHEGHSSWDLSHPHPRHATVSAPLVTERLWRKLRPMNGKAQ